MAGIGGEVGFGASGGFSRSPEGGEAWSAVMVDNAGGVSRWVGIISYAARKAKAEREGRTLGLLSVQ